MKRREIRRIAAEAADFADVAERMLGLRDARSKRLKGVTDRQRDEFIRVELASISIESLADRGVGAEKRKMLSARGLATFDDLRAAQPRVLFSLPGIGEAAVSTIQSAVRAAVASANKAFARNCDLARRDHLDTAFLAEAFVADRIHHIDSNLVTQVAAGLRIARVAATANAPAHGWFRWLFTGGASRATAVEGVTSFEKWLSRNAGIIERANAAIASTVIDSRGVWDVFDRDPVAGVATLESAYRDTVLIVNSRYGGSGSTGGTAGSLGSSTLVDLTREIDNSDLEGAGHFFPALRPYQVFGAKFIIHQRQVILGDEMGLGKTIQALAAIAHLAAGGETHFVVATPLSLVRQWRREIALKTDLRSISPHGGRLVQDMLRWTREGGIAVMSIDTLKGVPPKLGEAEVRPSLLVIDEAQAMKNPSSLRAWGMKDWVRVSQRTAMLTGTPLENRIDEFVSLESQLQAQREPSIALEEIISPREFRRRVAPVYLRRNQREVLSELPTVLASDVWVDPQPGELKAYRKAVSLGDFHAMRQASMTSSRSSPKLERIRELVQEAAAEGWKVVIFSYYRETLKLIAAELQNVAGIIDGSVRSERRDEVAQEFQDSTGHSVLLAQITTGGQGLNLQSARVSIICEPQVKPSTEDQAVARLQRFGQEQRVHAYRLVARGTVDERLLDALERKQRLFDQYARRSDLADESRALLEMGDVQLTNSIIEAEQTRLESFEGP